MENAVDYAASRLFGGNTGGEQGRNGRTVKVDRAPVFDLGCGAPVPVLKKPMRADALAALQAVEEAARTLDQSAALILMLCRDHELPLVPRGIATVRYAVGDFLHNVDAALRAHQSTMARG